MERKRERREERGKRERREEGRERREIKILQTEETVPWELKDFTIGMVEKGDQNQTMTFPFLCEVSKEANWKNNKTLIMKK